MTRERKNKRYLQSSGRSSADITGRIKAKIAMGKTEEAVELVDKLDELVQDTCVHELKMLTLDEVGSILDKDA